MTCIFLIFLNSPVARVETRVRVDDNDTVREGIEGSSVVVDTA